MQADMFKDDLSQEDRVKLAELNRENPSNIEDIFRGKIYHLETLQKQLEIKEADVKDLKQRIARIEEDEIPNLMDELQVNNLAFQGGLSITLDDKVYTRVNKSERERGWELLREKGFTGIIKPVVIVTIAQNETRKEIEDLLNIIKNSIEFEAVELDFDYHAGQLSAVARDITDNGDVLDAEVFKQSVKRGVKIKQKNLKPKTTRSADYV